MENFFSTTINHYPLWAVFWNIFLAFIPCTIVYHMAKSKWVSKKTLFFGIGFLVWFFSFPNTSYLFTMPRYLLSHCTDYTIGTRLCFEESWQVMFFFGYALIGLPLFLYALRKMTLLLGHLFNKTIQIWFPIIMIPITALGTLLGLLERFDSWDVLHNPLTIIQTSLTYITEPWKALNLTLYTIALYFIYYGGIWLIKKAKHL
jgi:uncharacterized membrane protein